MRRKKLPKWMTKHPGAALVLLCYAVAVLGFAAVRTVDFAQNRAAYAAGDLAPATLTLDDFELNEEIYIREDGALVTAGADPQLLLKDKDRRVENVTLNFAYSRAPRIRQVFWAVPGQDYDLRKSAYPFGGETDGEASFLLPATGGRSLRIDPDSESGTVITFGSVTINTMRPFWQFYLPGAGDGLALAVVPLLVGCGVGTVIEAGLGFTFLRRNRRGNDKPVQNPDAASGEAQSGEGAAPHG